MTTLLLLFGNTSVMDLINRLDNFHYLLKRFSDSFYTLTVECYRGVIVLNPRTLGYIDVLVLLVLEV